MESNRKAIIRKLLDDSALLIPYDAKLVTCQPACLKGERPHWCICTGFAFRVRLSELNKRVLNKLDESPDDAFVDLKRVDLGLRSLLRLLDRSMDLYLFCKQGQSGALNVFDFEELVQSNKNLFRLGFWVWEGNYLIPEEGIGKSLRDKFVVIS